MAVAATEAAQAEAGWEVNYLNHPKLDFGGGSYAWWSDYQYVLGKLRETESQLATAKTQYADSLAEAKAEIERLKADVTEAREVALSLVRVERTVTCVFCGQTYDKGTPTSQDDRLTAHIKVCEKHPLRQAEADAAKWKGLYEAAWAECEGWRFEASVRGRGATFRERTHDTARREAGLEGK